MFAEFWRVLLFLESISILNVNFSIVLSILHATNLFIVFLLCLEIGLLNDMFTKELQCTRFHYSDVIMDTMASHITSLTIIYLTVIDAEIKKNIKAPRHWPLCGEFTGGRWIPRTNGQLRGKCFHLMTSSCRWITLSLVFTVISIILMRTKSSEW